MPRRIPISIKRQARARPPTPYIPKVPLGEKAPAKVRAKRRKLQPFVPRTRPSNAQQIYAKTETALASAETAHFRVGGKQIYFPQAKIVLLRPSAKHTPYQAKFIVPRYFNKLDLRDYLFHVYGLRALNVTTQLLWSQWKREAPGRPRYRTPQIKKMTIEMDQPFVWPEPIKEEVKNKDFQIEFFKELDQYARDASRLGSDRFRPPKAFGGIIGPYQAPAEPFVPKRLKRQLLNHKAAAEKEAQRQTDLELVRGYLGM